VRALTTPSTVVLLALVGVHLEGCAGRDPGAEPCILPVQIELTSGDRLNPNDDGEPLPTEIRLLQLRSLVKLQEAEFDAVIADPTAALGGDLVVTQDFTLYPATPHRVAIELDPEARFLVGVALVRRPSGTMWRSVVVLPPVAARCGDFLEDGAPDPAVIFRVQDYRISATSNLGGSAGSSVLPNDVTR